MKRYLMIIGINNYNSSGIPSLNYAVADAEGIKSILSTKGDCCFPEENQIVLCNVDATREKIISGLDFLIDKCNENDLVVFYYSGHGYSEVHDKGDSDDKLLKYLIPTDTDINNINSTAIDFNFLNDKLKRIRSKRLVMLFDCCYSGAAGGRTFFIGGEKLMPKRIGSEYLDRISGSGRTVITACTGSEVAIESSFLGHGVFTHYILEGLKGSADIREDGYVDLEELWFYIQEKTTGETENNQNPVRAGWIEGGTIYLSHLQKKVEIEVEKESLRQKIIEKFSPKCNLQEVLISDSEELSHIGKIAAKYLEERLKSNYRIAVSCGSTLVETISQMSRLSHREIKIFPTNGAPSGEVHLTDSMVLSYLLWSKFEPGKARAHIMPIGVPSELFEKGKEAISKRVKEILEMAKEADVFLFGIGTPSKENKNIRYFLEKSNLTLKDIVKMGAVGEISFLLFDKNGVFLDLNEDLSKVEKEKMNNYDSTFFSLSPRDFYEISKKPGIELIAVAGGESKRIAILAGIKGGLIKTLITDINTANWLVETASI